jgi:methyltransferase (TIGR00027 family)
VLEVDHPATQARKRRLLDGLVPLSGSHVFVQVDFEKQSLSERLAQAPFDRSEPTLFVWEGVTMYLSEHTIARTLAELGSLAAPGSTLVMTYMDDSGASGPASHSTHVLAAAVGERFRSALSPDAARAAVERSGFSVLRDTGYRDWAGSHGLRARGRVQERVLLGERNALGA